MSDTESFESVMDTLLNGFTHDVRTDELSGSYKMIAARLDRLKAAHDRKIGELQSANDRKIEELQEAYDLALAQARDPQRLHGTKPETFDGAIEALREFRWQHATNDEDAISYINAVKEMHDREIRDTAQQEYDRGFHDGQHSMDAEHRAVAMRLRALHFADGGCHGRLSEIAHAVYPEYRYAWTQGACAELRDELVRLMGGVSDDTRGAGCCCAASDSDGDCGLQREEVEHGGAAHDCADDSRGGSGSELVHMDGLVGYDVLWNERQKAVCELRKMAIDSDYHSNYQRIALAIGTVYDGESFASECVRDRLIHLLGGDQPSGIDVLREMDNNGTCPNDGPTSSITDELREFVGTFSKRLSISVAEVNAIADRIDAQFDRICKQQEAVLQETIDEMVSEIDKMRKEVIELRKQRHNLQQECGELQAKLDESDQLRIEKLERQRDHWHQEATDMMNHADAMEHERDELQEKLDELEKLDADTSLTAFGDDNSELRRLLSRAAKLLEIAEHDRDTNYAYWMDCKEKVVHANITIDELQAKLDSIRDALDG